MGACPGKHRENKKRLEVDCFDMGLEFLKDKFKEVLFDHPEKTVCEIVPLQVTRRYLRGSAMKLGASWVVGVRDPHDYNNILILPKAYSPTYPEADKYSAIVTHGRFRPLTMGTVTIVLKDQSMFKHESRADNSITTLGAA